MSLISVITSGAILLLLLLLFSVALRFYVKLTVGRCKCNVNLNGKTALITGGNSGLGYQTALALAGKGCRVIIADKDNCDQTKQEIINKTGNTNIVIKQFNLASLSSIRRLARDITETEGRLDILINNAGVGGVGNVYTEDGLHMGMQINHFGPFLLTHLLIGLLKKSTPSRIIFVSSWLAFFNNLNIQNLNYPSGRFITWSDFRIYANSKLCNIICAKEFSNKLHGTGITANALHPGLVYTPIFSKAYSMNPIYLRFVLEPFLQLYAKDPEEGAQTTIHLALSKEGEKVSGEFFADCRVGTHPSKANDLLFRRAIWEASEKFVKLCPKEML